MSLTFAQKQAHLVEIFVTIKALIKKYEGPLVPKIDLDSKYDLWSIKDIVIEGRRKKEVAFAGLIIQSNYVGFYFMPIYAEAELKNVFGEKLLKLLKGKTCFRVKQVDPELLDQIAAALESGYALYQKRGWI
ncbi:MAG TPA: hypothetical protein VLH18_05075 [Candidatus Limnocylindrales bacterium]|nr:hypothetical protein [Candidatus Limnocylindrales bacterium]